MHGTLLVQRVPFSPVINVHRNFHLDGECVPVEQEKQQAFTDCECATIPFLIAGRGPHLDSHRGSQAPAAGLQEIWSAPMAPRHLLLGLGLALAAAFQVGHGPR